MPSRSQLPDEFGADAVAGPVTAIRIGSSHERCLTNRVPRCAISSLYMRWVLSSALAIAALAPLRCSSLFGLDSANTILYCITMADAISDRRAPGNLVGYISTKPADVISACGIWISH